MMNWKQYMEDYDEGLGTVYERFMLDEYFKKLLSKHNVKSVLEVPIFGMTGVSGINSVYFARNGCKVTLIDDNDERIKDIKKVWGEINEDVDVGLNKNFSELPFNDNSFSLVWNFAALDHVEDVDSLINEMFRISSDLVLIFIPNKFFSKGKVEYSKIKKKGNVIDEGIIDVPPWPDTKISIKRSIGKTESKKWRWSMVDYLKGDEGVKNKIMKYTFVEKFPLPWRLKLVWAHHRFLLFKK